MTQMFSPTALVVGLYREFFELDLVNTYASLILTQRRVQPGVRDLDPAGLLLLDPREVEEAARWTAAAGIATLRRVMLPLTLPGLVPRR